MRVRMLDVVRERQHRGALVVLPFLPHGAPLKALSLRLGDVGEVGIDMRIESQRGGLLGEVGHIDVFVKAVAHETRDPELYGVLSCRSSRTLRDEVVDRLRGRGDVVAQPGMLLDVGQSVR